MKLNLPSPPAARRDPTITRLHDSELHDDYAWMRDKSSPEVIEYPNQENAYTAAAMAGTEKLQAELYEEILSHIKEDDVSVPYRDGDWEYLTRTEKGRQYGIYIRRRAEQVGAQEERSEERRVGKEWS